MKFVQLSFYLRWFGFLLLVVGLSSCSAPGPVGLPGQAVVASMPATSAPTAAPSPKPTLRATPTIAPTPSLTASPSPDPVLLVAVDPTMPPCIQAGGRVEISSLPTDLLRLPLDYRVYLPPCYDQSPEKSYPVLYLIHGQSYSDDQWDRLGVDETADALIASGELPPFLIVMPRDRYGGQPTENNFAEVVLKELIPQIDSTYRTLADRDHRAVGGLSRGAGWAVHLAITHPEMFSALGAHSPAIFYTDAQMMRTWLDEIPVEALPRIYIDLGDKDRPEITDVSNWFADLLNQRSIPHEWHLFTGYHTEEYWSAHVEQYLRWYAQDW
jgi:enterochelin esterase-like enzyme